jgi:LL-diaminopimelate aminotransferase
MNVMQVSTASRLANTGEYYFSRKLRELAALNAAGANIISLGIGSPDLPPHPSVVAALATTASQPNTHGYQSYQGTPVLRQAMADFYQRSYGVTLDPATEVLPLAGSKEGLMHIGMAFLEAGDAVLIPNPGYPTYRPDGCHRLVARLRSLSAKRLEWRENDAGKLPAHAHRHAGQPRVSAKAG